MIAGALPGILDQFYSHIGRYQHIAKLFPTDAIMRHAKEAQISHWATISAAALDETYV